MNTIDPTNAESHVPEGWTATSDNNKLQRYCQKDRCNQTIKECRNCGWKGCPYCKAGECCTKPKLRMPGARERMMQDRTRLAKWGGGKTIGEIETAELIKN